MSETQNRSDAYYEAGRIVMGYELGVPVEHEGTAITPDKYAGAKPQPKRDPALDPQILINCAAWQGVLAGQRNGEPWARADEEINTCIEFARGGDVEYGDRNDADNIRRLVEAMPDADNKAILSAYRKHESAASAIISHPAALRDLDYLADILRKRGKLTQGEVSDAMCGKGGRFRRA